MKGIPPLPSVGRCSRKGELPPIMRESLPQGEVPKGEGGICFSNCKIILLFALFLFTLYSNAQTKNCYTTTNPTEFQLNIDSFLNETILDVRPFGDLKNKAIAGALFAPSINDLEKLMDTLDTDTPILVYCVVGIRSEKVCEILCENNFKTVINLKGGFDKWKKKGFETVDLKKE